MKKRWLIAPVVTGALIFGALTGGAVMTQEHPNDGNTRFGNFTSRVAEILGVEQDEVADAMRQARGEMQDAAFEAKMGRLVENGVLTQEQADEAIDWYQSKPEDIPGMMLGRKGRHGHGGHFGGVEQRLERLVENGIITQEQADEYQAWFDAKPDFLGNGIGEGRGRGMHRGFHRGPRFNNGAGFGDRNPDVATDATVL